MDRRLNIGLFINDLEDDYASAICSGAAFAAEEADVNIIVLPARYLGMERIAADEWLNKNYNTLFEYADSESLDVLIFNIGPIFSGVDKQDIERYIARYAPLPIVTIAVPVDGCSCVQFDQRKGLEGLLEHLIAEHGYRRIAYVSGPEDNSDAQERLTTYRDVMARHGIPVEEDMIAYGNFSEYSRRPIGRLLDAKLPDIDAICCANDGMALLVCKMLRERGLQPGKDIAVTGYDNIPRSIFSVPPLTTVGADASELGYQSVLEAIRLVAERQPQRIASPTEPMLRESCGCAAAGGSVMFEMLPKDELGGMIRSAIEGCPIGNSGNRASGMLMRSWLIRLKSVISRIAQEAVDESVKGFSHSAIVPAFRQIISGGSQDTASINAVGDVLFALRDSLIPEITDKDKELEFYRLLMALQRTLTNIAVALQDSMLREVRRSTVVINSIHNFDENNLNAALQIILEHLSRMNINGSWLYLLDEPRRISDTVRPRVLRNLAVRGYHVGVEYSTRSAVEGRISKSELFTNRFIPADTRHTMILLPLFSSREQYGLILCDLPREYFSYVQGVSRQVSTALETMHLLSRLNEQMDEMSSHNALLRTIASRDELTGCYNRRGFFELSERIARLESNTGRRAVVVFADLDNLKKINDTYGHDEGDFALRASAMALSKSFGHNSIIGRIGGDEFAVFDLIGNSERLEDIYRRVKDTVDALDESSGKRYHIAMSLGLTELMCDGDVVVRGFVDKADKLQYGDKRKKRRSVEKSADAPKP